MILRAQELCRKLQPVLGKKINRLWTAYLAESDPGGKAEIEQTLELLAAKHLKLDFQPDRSPFPPPPKKFAESGDLAIGSVRYGNRDLYPFLLQSGRLKEHLLVAGRSGSGKTNLTFVLMQGIISNGIKVLAMDWKRGYRDLLELHPDLRIYTIGRDVSPFRFNPLIPPSGCEPHVWIKLIVDVIANAYLGGEGVISLLVGGLDHLYREHGVFDGRPSSWPTIADLLAWLRTAKLKGRAGMWQASAERILLAMIYGEFGAVLNTQDNSHIQGLLDHNVVMEMDGLSSSSDRTMFSEALTVYLYRYRLALGPQERLTNVIVLEEAHNLLLAKPAGTRESVLETSIRMIRQYGLGYVFVDQSASLLSKVAFANSYATIALSQKLRADVRTIGSAMNLTDEQNESLSTLPIGTAVVRLADEHPEPFLVKIPRSPVREGSVSDSAIRVHMDGCSGGSGHDKASYPSPRAVSGVPASDKYSETNQENNPHPPTPMRSPSKADRRVSNGDDRHLSPRHDMSREEIRFLADLAAKPLSTTLSRYQRLNLSRRRGNGIRQHLGSAGIIEAVPIATRSGQVVLYQLTDSGRRVCTGQGIDPGPRPRTSLEHSFWVTKTAEYFERRSFTLTREHAIKGNGAIDLLAERPGERIAIEIETGKSDIKANLRKIKMEPFDQVVLVATSPAAVTACQRAIDNLDDSDTARVELLTWLDVS